MPRTALNRKKGVSMRKVHKNPTGGLSAKGRAYYNAKTGSNLKAPAPNGKPGTKAGARKKSFCARSKSWNGERGKAARARWKC